VTSPSVHKQAHRNLRRRFFDLADRLAAARDPAERQRLKQELARMTFGQ